LVSFRVELGQFSNPEFDYLVERAASLSDPAERQSLYVQAERILCEAETAIIPLYHSTYAAP
jgi:ABC-type oligopeptide transport system substrate-binding subunit